MIDRVLKVADVFSPGGDIKYLLLIRLLSSDPDCDFRLKMTICFLKLRASRLSPRIRDFLSGIFFIFFTPETVFLRRRG